MMIKQSLKSNSQKSQSGSKTTDKINSQNTGLHLPSSSSDTQSQDTVRITLEEQRHETNPDTQSQQDKTNIGRSEKDESSIRLSPTSFGVDKTADIKFISAIWQFIIFPFRKLKYSDFEEFRRKQ
jgi:hypothetical protein